MLYNFGQDLVKLLKDNGDKAFVKVIRSNRYRIGAGINVAYNQLTPVVQKKKPATFLPILPPNSCPTCDTPHQISGIECPGCGFKEWLKCSPNS